MHENAPFPNPLSQPRLKFTKHSARGFLSRFMNEAFCGEFHLRGIKFEHQKPVPINHKRKKLATDPKLDPLVEEEITVDAKAKGKMTNMNLAKTLTHIRLTGADLTHPPGLAAP